MKSYNDLAYMASQITLSKEVEYDLIIKAQRGSLEARDRLTEANMGLILHICIKYNRVGVSGDALMADGIEGFYEAIEKFDINTGNRLSTYAFLRVRTRVLNSDLLQGSVKVPSWVRQDIKKIEVAREELRNANKSDTCVFSISEISGLTLNRIKNAVFARENLLSIESLQKTIAENFSLLETLPA